MLPLFDEPKPPGPLARRLAELAREGVYLGTSSWKYEGWLGQVYTPERYFVRRRFSRKKFESECLAEYAETFPVVCGDFSFYQFPSETYWHRLFGSAPAALRFAFKVPEEITCKTFPAHARYGPRAGLTNESFLDTDLFRAAFLAPLGLYRERVAALIFEFGTFSRQNYPRVADFLADLDRFLATLPGGFRYSVEVRNPEYLEPGYFACLRSHGVAHVFNAWTRMPELSVQTGIEAAYTADFTVTRALLRRGRSYEEAVQRFSPYREIQDVNPPAREAIRKLIGRARDARREAFVFVNNRMEGNAPESIQAIVEGEAG